MAFRTGIIPQTTSIPLSERFKRIESQASEETVVGPVRTFKLALDLANESTRLSARERLGPKLVTTEQRSRTFIPSKRLYQPGMKQNQVTVIHKPIKRINNNFRPQHRFLTKQFVKHKIPQAKNSASNNKFTNAKRFVWKNPALVKNKGFVKRPPKANKDQLDNDLDAYMSQSTGYLNSF